MRKTMKRVAWVFGGLFALLLVAAVAIPMFVDVDSYRPQIVTIAKEYLNGDLEVGKLKLSLWGQIRVDVDGVKLKDKQGSTVFSVEKAYFHFPFAPLLTASPTITFVAKQPELTVVKDKSGKLNVLTLVKLPTSEATPEPTKPESSSGKALPAIALRARLGLSLEKARLAYRDAATALDTKLENVNFSVRDLSASRPVQIDASAEFNLEMAATTFVKGPIEFHAVAEPVFTAGKFDRVQVQMRGDAGRLEIRQGNVFFKSKQVPANFDMKVTASTNVVDVLELNGQFHNAKLTGSLKMDLTTQAVQAKFSSNPVQLSAWKDLVPMLAEFALQGEAQFNASARGTTAAPDYDALFQIKALTAKAPMLKAQPTIDAHIKVATDRIEDMQMTMKAPNTDLKVQGKLTKFLAPSLGVTVVSKSFDLDAWIEFPKSKATATKPGAAQVATAEKKEDTKSNAPASDYDAMLKPVRENAILGKANADMTWKFDFIRAYGVSMRRVEGKATFKNLRAAIEKAHVALFNGDADAHFALELKPKTPTYNFKMNVLNLSLKEAVASQFELFKNTLLGNLSFQMEGNGASFNPDPAKVNLNAKGSMLVKPASFATMDIGREVTQAVSRTMADLGNKVPQLKGKSVSAPGSIDSEYESVSSTFTVSKGTFSAPDFFAKSKPGKGIDIKGATSVGLKDYALQADWEVIDTHNTTRTRDMSVDVAGTHVPHVLAKDADPVRFPLSVRGTVFSPKVTYTSMVEALAKVATYNLGKALEGRAKAEIQKKVVEQLKTQAPPEVQNAVQDLSKKLGF